MIKAPFNFVPLNDNVFFPGWANQISHDIPFEDGESGVIELTITAKSPIFVRNGHTKSEADNSTENYKSFSKVNDKYFIPGTSIKGAIRNVLEIISLGKMNKITNSRYSLRDLQLTEDYLKFFPHNSVHCGWLTKSKEILTITDHGIPRRVSHNDLDSIWGTDFTEKFKDKVLLKDDAKRTALYKINLAKTKNKAIQYNEFPMNSVNKVDNRVIAKIDAKGSFSGEIVLTGQPSARKEGKKASGKCFEFVFPDSAIKQTTFNEYDDIYKDFCFIYKGSEDWKYWKKELEKGQKIPVFFSLVGGEIKHFGLSYLYKLPYPKRMKDYLPESHLSELLDLSECIMGSSQKDKSLKGRVQFTHAFLQKGEIAKELQFYMGSPKSTYYPIYIKQEGANGIMSKKFVTMMSPNASLKGWKRYPIRTDLLKNHIPEGQSQNASPFVPIKEGGEFRCSIKFHNLKKIEIGALLKAIHFSNNGFHSIGYAKPYGYGKVEIKSDLKKCKFTKEEYIKSFIEHMNENIENYNKLPMHQELTLMSIPQEKTISPLEYMDLEEFVDHKKQNFKKGIYGQYLDYYSKIVVKEIVRPVKLEAEAIVSLVSGSVIQAKLIEGKDVTPKTLKIEGNKRPKQGNRINVEVIKKGGNIDYLIFKGIIK